MNQILYTWDNDNKTTSTNKNKKRVTNKVGITIISSLLVIPIAILFTINISSLNMTSKAMTQSENLEEETTKLAEEVSNQNLLNETTTSNEDESKDENKEQNQETKSTNTQTSGESSKKTTTSNKKGYSTIAYLKIPSLGIDYPVLSSTSPELLKISLNKYWGANPNEVGNMCIVGHNYNDSRFFGKLNKIKKNAEVKITDMTGKTLTYKVYYTGMKDPYDTSCTSQLTDGHTEITLITCNYDGSKRFVVKARAN